MNDRNKDPNFVKWAKVVKSRANFKCELCSSKGYLEAHHKNSWAAYPEQRYVIDNGVSLCNSCHVKFHEKFGKVTTEDQYLEFKATVDLFIKALEGRFLKIKLEMFQDWINRIKLNDTTVVMEMEGLLNPSSDTEDKGKE